MDKNLLHAEQMAAHWLYLGNIASEKGKHDLAERHYSRSQKWHDKMIEILERPKFKPIKVWHKMRKEFILIHELLPTDEEYFGMSMDSEFGDEYAVLRSSVDLEYKNDL